MSFASRPLHRRVSRATVAIATALALSVTGVAIWTSARANAATPDTIWGTGAPTSAVVDRDTSAVELGTRFTAVTDGQATGIRYYKTPENTGAHTGSLWTSSGTLLARVTFAGESSSGWQTAPLTSPVRLTAGTSYVVSYHTAVGRYLSTERYTGASASPNLRVPASAVGVYSYGAASSFPTSIWRASQYWVDLTFAATQTVTSTTPVATPTPPATASSTPATAPTTTTPPATATATATTNAPSVTAAAGTVSPTNKTTKQSTKNPALCTTSAVWSNLAACGWPGAANTGYPDGQVFSKTVSGGLTVSTDGAVIDGYRISGGVTVNAKNVTIRNSWITNSAGGVNGTGVVKVLNGAGATIAHNLLDGQNATHACIWHEGASMVATANECTGVNDGIFSWATTVGVDGTGDNFSITDNWLHNFTTLAANGHVDGYQTEGAKNGVISHNTFDVAQDQTSAISIWNGRKNASNIAVSNNLIQGGGFSVYAEDYSPSEANPAGGYTVTSITFTNNRFSNSRYACVGNWGVWFTRGAPSDGWHRSGNTLLETGQNLDNNNPIVNGWECR